MRKSLLAVATAIVVGLGVMVPVSSAQASASCDNAWQNSNFGYFYAYQGYSCSIYLGRDQGNDPNWGDNHGGFRGSDNNAASSILHKGTSGMAVKVYDHKYGGGHTCLKQAEYYMSILSGHKFTSGENVNNDISSHQWVWHGSCSRFLDS